MTYHYGSSSSSSSSSTPSSSPSTGQASQGQVNQSQVNQRQAAPPGFHYMPDGTLMSDAEHAALYGNGSQGLTRIEANNNIPELFPPIGGRCTVNDFKTAGDTYVLPMMELLNPNLSSAVIQQQYSAWVLAQWDNYNSSTSPIQKCNWLQSSVSTWSILMTQSVGQAAVQAEAYHSWGQMLLGKCGCHQTITQARIMPSTLGEVSTRRINDFDLDLSDLPATGETRKFIISGERGAKFKLEIKDKDTGKYYNFTTNLFQTSVTCLYGEIEKISYTGSVVFPAVTGADDQYDIYLFAEENTEHGLDLTQARFGDGSIDLNNSTGSDSFLIQKVIYQYAALTLTINGYSAGGTIVGTNGSATISINRNKSNTSSAFSFTFTAASTSAYRILKQPVSNDVLAFIVPTVGAAPVQLPGENIYPDVTGTDTVDGAVTSGVNVTMDANVDTKMKIGDRVTGNAALNATTVTVAAVNVGSNAKVFAMSEAIALADGLSLSFSNQMNYQWPVSNFANIVKEDMIIAPGGNILANTKIAKYQDVIKVYEGTPLEETLIKNERPAVDTLGKKPTVVKGLVTVQEGNIVFDKQQPLVIAEQALKIGGYGENEILRVFDWDVRFTDLAITLTAPTTTTTEATSAHAVIAVADKEGVINNVSRVSGIGINPAVQNPLITSGGGADGPGDWTMDAVQSLENGTTLTIENTGRVATVTGNIHILKAGTASQTLRFDVDKLLSTSAP